MVMFKIGLFALSLLMGVSRSPLPSDTVSASHNTEGDYYYYNCLYSHSAVDTDNSSISYTFNRSWELDTYNNDYLERTSIEDKPCFYDYGNGSTGQVENGIFFLYSSNDFTIRNDFSLDSDNNNVVNQTANFDSSSNYLLMQYNFNGVGNDGYGLADSFNNYAFAFDLYSNIPNLMITYNVSYTIDRNYALYQENYQYYGGTINVDTNTRTINIPYPSSLSINQRPNFVDSQFYVINIVFTSTASYATGYNAGYNEGFTTGSNNGYSVGYDAGFVQGSNSSTSFVRLLTSIADTPIYYLRALFNIELFGINVFAVVTSMITAMVILWVIKKFVL